MTVSTLPACCAWAARTYGDAPYIEDGDTKLSFRQFNAERRRFAAALLASGVEPGDRVMILAPNCAHWLIAAMGIASIGAIMIPVSTRFTGREIEDLALRGGARMIVSVGDFLKSYYPDLLTPATRDQVNEVVVIGRAGHDTAWDDFMARAGGVPDETLATHEDAVTGDTVSDILFTSGTTGRSKGVMYAHKQFIDVVTAWTARVGLRKGDRTLVIPPFFHAFGYRGGAIGSLIVGATVLPHQAFDAGEVLERVARDRVTVIPGPPAIFQGMLNHPGFDQIDRSSLRLGITGGAVIPSVLVERMRNELGCEGVCNGYGLTECGGYGTMCNTTDPIDVVAKTAGPPMPSVEIEMMDEAGRILPRGETGEIVVRGYIVMQGYFDDPEATAATIDAEGWLHTGDVGRLDAAGNLVVEDRLKDMFIAGGFNCYPAEIERILSSHPAVGQAAVIGIPDARLGEVGKAFVVLRPGTRATPDELIAWSRENMANYKVPRVVEIRATLPVSPQGKVLKRELA
ncbi:AMP-binding protein [Thalassorhabdomicrobium marinisediminis]|uniref:Fatty acid--CoA ligase n=1 Tax=Thalassorhabdomicrobium marinisediminis TaxID=2170577 RepID=A0A2T7FUQ3_9RHOB|nr:AMP-binding protein [Thalassorhabdomicrobium marinisediminis]PVA05893.1 fatty acid--CoA ligase [Thalassorhabdomicrobium marinisediminis]